MVAQTNVTQAVQNALGTMPSNLTRDNTTFEATVNVLTLGLSLINQQKALAEFNAQERNSKPSPS